MRGHPPIEVHAAAVPEADVEQCPRDFVVLRQGDLRGAHPVDGYHREARRHERAADYLTDRLVVFHMENRHLSPESGDRHTDDEPRANSWSLWNARKSPGRTCIRVPHADLGRLPWAKCWRYS